MAAPQSTKDRIASEIDAIGDFATATRTLLTGIYNEIESSTTPQQIEATIRIIRRGVPALKRYLLATLYPIPERAEQKTD